MDTKLYVYILKGFSDFTLWFLFKEEFKGWTKEDFANLRRDTRAEL